ncbi:splicing factor, Prp19-binding domain-containing protein [Myxozyma melibiosi]|uniref:Splicing factor, Prp19-binding domain-containing protein n=1 Tax=Myxozyma melibiosi TaxID=54550 RepID=A0ABR1F622_9ASCO
MPPRAQQIKRTRYFPGKRTSRTPSPDPSSSDDERDQPEDADQNYATAQNDTPVAITEFAADEDKDEEEDEEKQSSRQIARRVVEPVKESRAKKESSESEESESDDDSEEESDESSEEEEPKRVLLRPIFVPKNKRSVPTKQATEAEEQLAVEAAKTQKKEATLLEIQNQIRLESEAHARRQQHEANDVSLVANADDIDDTDDLDPAAERAVWKLRELRRVKREREELEERERELEELQARREMDEEDKIREGLERVRQQQQEKKDKRGNVGFMQKYYHKGAFYQDDDAVKRRDFHEKTIDEVKDKTALPKILQVRGDDFGKRGRSKWTHLSAEDTSQGADSPWFDPQSRVNKRAREKLGGMHDAYPNKSKKPK